MRRILLFTLALSLIGFFNLAEAQCTVSPIAVGIGIPGFSPTPNSSVKDGKENSSYGTESITVISPADTTIDLSSIIGFPVPPVTVSVNYIASNAITGLPNGMSAACNPGSCNWPGGTNGCIGITGTPTENGNFTIDLGAVLNVDVPSSVPIIGGTTIDVPFPATYDLFVEPEVSVEEDLDPNKFDLAQNVPNPANQSTKIFFNSPRGQKISLEVHNLIGVKVFSTTITANSGLNEYELSTANLKSGIYFFSVKEGNNSLTRKMVVSR